MYEISIIHVNSMYEGQIMAKDRDNCIHWKEFSDKGSQSNYHRNMKSRKSEGKFTNEWNAEIHHQSS